MSLTASDYSTQLILIMPRIACGCANPSRTCANLREFANASRIRERVANLRELARTLRKLARICRECAENFRESVVNLRNPDGELSRICRESVNIRCESARPNAKSARIPQSALHVTC
eukprot:3537712-Prymnesium_polylepis.1